MSEGDRLRPGLYDRWVVESGQTCTAKSDRLRPGLYDRWVVELSQACIQ